MEMVLMGVAGCTAMDVVSILKKKRSSFTDLHVNISGNQAEEHPKRCTDISIEFVVHGKGAKPGDVERSIELSVTKYCSAMASINAEVEHTYHGA
jgi:putative redox protein